MEKTIYLHIGLPKTATSLIQGHFYNSAEELGRLGIHYLKTGTEFFNDSGHHILVMAALRDAGHHIHPGLPSETIATAWAAARAEVNSVPMSKIMISSELFSLDMHDWKAMIYMRDNFPGCQFKIILTLRDVVCFVNSTYAQRVRDGLGDDIQVFIDTIWPSLNWTHLVDRWIGVFGQENIILVNFDKLEKTSLVVDFARQVFGVEIDRTTVTAANVNSSLPHSAVAFLKELNAADITDEEKTHFRDGIHTFLGAHKHNLKRADFLSEVSKSMLRRHCVWPKKIE